MYGMVITLIAWMYLGANLGQSQTTTRLPTAPSPSPILHNSSTTSAASSTTTSTTTTTRSPQTFRPDATSTVSPFGQGQRNITQQDGSVWLRCVGQSRPREETTVVNLLTSWCQQNETIVGCLSRDFGSSRLNNAFDFFVNLTFNQQRLRRKSVELCSRYQEKKDKFGCALTSNQSHASSCLGSFSSGLAHIFGLHTDKKMPLELLRDVACDVLLQTTLCLRDSLTACEEDVQTVLVNYYSLVYNDTCIAKFGQSSGTILPETVVDKCAKEAAERMPSNQHEPASLRDFLILGLRTDCKTYPVRYECYGRELGNITNFRDFWLSLTFDYDNAMASQKTYCDQIETKVISKISENCFTQAHPNLASCEIGFGRELEAIRDEWFGNANLDGLELQTMACRTSMARAACLNHAMQPCGSEVATIMAVSEMGILPDICRQLLVPESSPQDLLNKSDNDLTLDRPHYNPNGNQVNGVDRSRGNSNPISSSTPNHLRSGETTQVVPRRSTTSTTTTNNNPKSEITGNVHPNSAQLSPSNNSSRLRTDPTPNSHQQNVSTTTIKQQHNSNEASSGQINIAVFIFLSVFWLSCIT
uniref:Uncharacterized protein n=1 Tax=Biomphalaria glabrata TaxID=6526 RepID=A0A2C9L5A3_BIOGL